MKTIRTLLVDDEPLAREGLRTLLAPDSEIEVIGACADGEEALAAIRAQRPDLVFLDVQMPRFDGFQVIEALAPVERPVVVFVTAYEQHAIRAFEVSAIDYLLKPFSDRRFAEAVKRAKLVVHRGPTTQLSDQIQQLLDYARRFEAAPHPGETDRAAESAAVRNDAPERIVFKADGALHFIRTHDIVWIEAQGDFIKVQTTAAKGQMVRETLQSLERRMPGRFLRIHRSYVVNADHVRRVETALYGDYNVHMSDGTKLRLSRNYRSRLKTFLKQNPAAALLGGRQPR